jgi:hypothetical protein
MTEEMEFPGQMWAFLSDGVGILVGSMMGCTSNTVYIESAAGIEARPPLPICKELSCCMTRCATACAPLARSPYVSGKATVIGPRNPLSIGIACSLLGKAISLTF